MRPEGDMVAPLLFLALGGVVGAICVSLFELIILGIVRGWEIGSGPRPNGPQITMMEGVAKALVRVASTPFLLILSVFASSGMKHTLLLLVGGATYGFDATFRCDCYVSGGLCLLFLIPGCGYCVYMMVYCVVMANALSLVQETDLGRSYLAVLGGILMAMGLVVGILWLAASGALPWPF